MAQNDDFYKELNSKWEVGFLDPLLYLRREGVFFYYKNMILINPTSPLTQVLIAKHHDTPTGGALRL